MNRLICLALCVLPVPWVIADETKDPQSTQPVPVVGAALLKKESAAVRPLMKSAVAGQFLRKTDDLPGYSPRTIYRNPKSREFHSKSETAALGKQVREALESIEVSETLYYTTKFGTPLAYSRVLELLGQAGLSDLAGKRVMDFGCGTIGHLRLMASCGADAVGVDVDSLLRAMYSEPGDQGTVKNTRGPDGKVSMVIGRWPADTAAKTAVGGGYDLITSKNTLKNGFFHPEHPVPKNRLVDVGVDDKTFVKSLFDALKPDGMMMIYNICPAPSRPDEPYKHWADGRCPFPKDMLESAGFRVFAFDRDDSEAVRKMAHALEWDRGDHPMDLENDLFAHYTLLKKPMK